MMDEDKVFRTIVVSAPIAALARQLAAALPSGIAMFVAGYSTTGDAPATHYVSEGWVVKAFADALASPEALVNMLVLYKQQMTLDEARALLSQAVVSEDPAAAVLSELGLVPVGSQL